jgi:hypothetical protein
MVQSIRPDHFSPLSNLYFTQHFREQPKTQNWINWAQQWVFALKSQNASPLLPQPLVYIPRLPATSNIRP